MKKFTYINGVGLIDNSNKSRNSEIERVKRCVVAAIMWIKRGSYLVANDVVKSIGDIRKLEMASIKKEDYDIIIKFIGSRDRLIKEYRLKNKGYK